MWSGRFREPLNTAFEQWQRSFPFDWRLLPQEIAASKAHARMIAAAGILTDAELAEILRGLALVGESATKGDVVVSETPQAEDIHHFVELELTKHIGTLALKLHTGRSRNEQIATDLRLFTRDAIDAALRDLANWAEALVSLAESAGDAVMPSYTHLQRAEPVLVSHWLLAYVEMILRDASRFADARKRLNLCPLGSGAIAGATLALDRTIAAAELGFYAPTANSMDATSDRDFALEFAQAASTLGLHISRFAEELTLHATAEFGFLDLPEAFSTGSSAMPQKKNPDLTELIRGKSGRLLGAVTTLSMILKGLPLAYNKDMQETQEATFEVAATLGGMLPLLAPFTSALKFRFDRMEAAAQAGYLNAMAAATYLVYKGVPFRTAHEKIGHAVRFGLDSGRELNDLAVSELKQFGEEFGDDFHDSITLRATVDCHDVIGGTATKRVREALVSARERVRAMLKEQDHGR
ncbi:argininosuccinate lyase [Terriglobus saanensis]|uniref:Argininosuccinate lyase n=1 Tax=Terriglobus saanensis (strain ATCC BAA-1853 / DSM 23119 / SP1PR4) TaxID=401053 RepID=E8V7T7_TERSS|nr:argininosuccinate lyase [Terriglobus saanensis]ADV82861.1 argininosuccinate lyase [Terriglobus saanensis SP1PR4]